MAFKTMSVEQLKYFLLGRKVPGTDLVLPNEAVQNLFGQGIDGPNLMILMDDLDELKAIVPSTTHRLQLKHIISSAQKESMCNDLVELVDEHPGLAMFTHTIAKPEDKENQLPLHPPVLPSYLPVLPSYLPVLPSSPLNISSSLSTSSQQSWSNSSPLQSCSNSPLTPLTNRSLNPLSSYGDCSNVPEYGAIDSPQINLSIPGSQSTPMKRKTSSGNKESSGIPTELPFPDRFSIPVEEAIKQNDILPVRLKLIKDVGAFYYSICKHPKQGDYARIAKKLCQRFPELRDVNADKYWKSVQQQVGMYFRNQRRFSAPKAKLDGNLEKRMEKNVKKAKIGDDATAVKRNLDLLKSSKENDFSKDTYKKLIDETYTSRRHFIQHEAKSIQGITEQCPFLAKPEHVLSELKRIVGEEKCGKAKDNLVVAFKALLKLKNSDLLTNTLLAQAMLIVETRTKRKGTGKLITFHDQSTPPMKMFKSKTVEFRVVCTGTVEEINQIFIAGEDSAVIECPTNDLLDALVYVIACYYVFDVSYPVCFQGVLGFLQDIGLCCVDDFYRGSKYNVLLAEIKKNSVIN